MSVFLSSEIPLQPNPAETGERCRLCGGGDFALHRQWDVGDYWNQTSIPLTLWACRDCELVMLWPVPTAEEYPGGGDWYSSQRVSKGRKYWFKTFRRRVQNKLIGTKTERFYKQCKQATSSGRFLDVGCGVGPLLELAAGDFDEVVGIEPSPIACEEVRKKGFRVFEGMLDEVEVEQDYYDLITMDAVIEHVLDPIATIRQLYDALAPGGYLGMVTVKLEGPTNRKRGGGWNGYRHGWHTILFTQDTLQQCLTKVGFEEVKRPRRARPFDDILILWGRKPL
ncbi:MAG: hypothetical protein CMO55_01380 [Verrucomicrobiales bacterium]|nr:hypothetical protein [Verrucomicrobiales bacterium]